MAKENIIDKIKDKIEDGVEAVKDTAKLKKQ